MVGSSKVGVPPNRPPRQQLHAYVSTEARDGWYGFAEANGANVTALLEATGILLGGHADTTDPRRLPPWLKSLVANAKEIASIRSTRRQRP